MVLVLIGIVSAVAAPMIFRGTSSIGSAAMARKVQDDIRYAQRLAMRGYKLESPGVANPSFRYRIRFNVADASCPGTNQYTIVNNSDNNATWGENPNSSGSVESAREPSTGDPYFCVSLETGDYKGFTITADFGGSDPGVLEFDNLGVPYDSSGVKLSAAKTITVAKDSENVTLTLTPYTGLVQ